MKRFPRVVILWLLLSLLAQAQEWRLLEPAMPVEGRPGEEVQVRLEGPPGAAVGLRTGETVPLQEEAPGRYFAQIRLPQAGRSELRLVTGGTVRSLGEIGTMDVERHFIATSETVTRQGPDSSYDRLTPLYPGSRVRIDGRRGDWYRSAGSGSWLDGTAGELKSGYLPPNRLERVLVETAPNGDALLRLEGVRAPEVQVAQSVAGGTLLLRLEDTYQTTFDITRETGTAPFLGPVLLRPVASPRRVEIELSARQLAGYQIEPQKDGDVVFRLRRPLPSDFRGLKITVDAGHGGPEDPGTVGHGGLAEKTLNLRVAEVLARMLEERGAEVIMTRTTDADVAGSPESASEELQARVDRSIEAGAHLFLSLHHNARPSVEEGKTAHGTDIYWYQPHSQALAQQLADPIADAVGEESRTYRWRSFYVIRQTHAPAVLIEFQYLSNPVLERDVLDREGYPERAARGVLEGLQRYLTTRR